MKNFYFKFLIYTFISFLSVINLSGQTFNFKCDSNYNPHKIYGLRKFIDSLNHIDFSKEDFEFRIYNYGAGQAGSSNNVFIMKHFIVENKWIAYFHWMFPTDFYYYKNLSNGELNIYDSKKLEEIWKMFLDDGILSISNPSPEVISKITNKNDIVCQVEDCQGGCAFELIKKDCKHLCYYPSCDFMCYPEFNNLPDYIKMTKILEFLDKVLRQEI